MKITPQEIHHKEFKHAMRGYNVEEVDIFLDEVADELERVTTENYDLRESAEHFKEKLQRFEDMSGTLQDTLIMAQRTADEIKAKATAEASSLLQNARDTSEKQLSESAQEAQWLESELTRLTELHAEFKKVLKDTILRFADTVELSDVPLIAEVSAVLASGPVADPSGSLESEPEIDLGVEIVVEPIIEPVAEPAHQNVSEQVQEKMVEIAFEPAFEPSPEPAGEMPVETQVETPAEQTQAFSFEPKPGPVEEPLGSRTNESSFATTAPRTEGSLGATKEHTESSEKTAEMVNPWVATRDETQPTVPAEPMQAEEIKNPFYAEPPTHFHSTGGYQKDPTGGSLNENAPGSDEADAGTTEEPQQIGLSSEQAAPEQMASVESSSQEAAPWQPLQGAGQAVPASDETSPLFSHQIVSEHLDREIEAEKIGSTRGEDRPFDRENERTPYRTEDKEPYLGGYPTERPDAVDEDKQAERPAEVSADRPAERPFDKPFDRDPYR